MPSKAQCAEGAPLGPLIATPHPEATRAGLAVLTAGGTAIEAAVAAGAVLAVALPHFNGLGGDAVWLIADGEGWATSLLGIGQAGERIPREAGRIETRGPGSALTTACLADGWETALALSAARWGGTRGFADLVEPAVRLAADGIEPSPSQRFWFDYRVGERAGWPGFEAAFGAGALSADGRLRQPGLAASLERLRRDGLRSFYEGELAERIVAGFGEAGIALTRADLAATRAVFAEPLRQAFGRYELLAPPAPTQGMTTLAIMAILDRLGIAETEDGGADFYHLAVEAVKQAFLRRGGIGDPRFDPDVSSDLLSPASIAAAAAAIDRSAARPWSGAFQHGDTVYLGVRDRAGRCVSLLQSTYFDWGSGVVVGDTGLLWHNRAAAFVGRAPGANAPQAGARPFYTLNPGLALRDGRPTLLYGTQGADGQPQTLALLLARTLAHGVAPDEALRRPRFLLGRSFSDPSHHLRIEETAGEAVVGELARRGHEIARLPALSPLCGQAGLIDLDPSKALRRRAVHDPRGASAGGPEL